MNNKHNESYLPYSYRAQITTVKVTKNYQNHSVNILKLDVSYPELVLINNTPSQNAINAYYRTKAKQFMDYVEKNLLSAAKDGYPSYIQRFSPPAYEAIMKYTVTLNSHCVLSTFSEQYTYSGGAHGSTKRTSATWNLNTGSKITIKDLLPEIENPTDFVIKQLIQIAKIKSITESPYFPEYETLIRKTFHPDQFYLTPDGITFYFQQYDIAPYAGGIIEFHVPFEEWNVNINCFTL